MQFQVPQFIETEDKIIGPLTIKQFLYLAVGGGLSFLLFFFLQLWLWILITFFIAIISLVFAFVRINGQSLTTVAMAASQFYWKPRMYLWQHGKIAQKLPEFKPSSLKTGAMEFGMGLKSHLDQLWEQLKTSKNPVPKREKAIQPSLLDRTKSSKERFEMMRKITGEREAARRVDYR